MHPDFPIGDQHDNVVHMSSEYDPHITPEMRARYILHRRDDIAKIDEAIHRRDFATLIAIAHQIKGNAATFSFQDLESYAIALEEAALAPSLKACSEAITLIRNWLERQA
jgi:HPt (histidine-containing phosphotransfer) domain-containing protein